MSGHVSYWLVNLKFEVVFKCLSVPYFPRLVSFILIQLVFLHFPVCPIEQWDVFAFNFPSCDFSLYDCGAKCETNNTKRKDRPLRP